MASGHYISQLGPTRLADVDDAPFILDMVNESIGHTFRISQCSQISYLIDNSVLSICQLDIRNKIIGFLCLRDYPLIPSVYPGAWEEYIWTKYKTVDLKARNTLFVHLLCWHEPYLRELVDNLLRTVFMHDQYLQYICMVRTDMNYPLLKPGLGRAEASFRPVQVMERGISSNRLPTLYVCDRKEVSPRLRIRRAVEEDNDDIVPIIERHSERLQELYGEFYVSELVARHPESERILLVCEHNEVAVGVMCLNTVINFEALEDCYDLSPYAGLRLISDCKKQTKVLEPSISVSELCIHSNQHTDVSAVHFDTLSREKGRGSTQYMDPEEQVEANDKTSSTTIYPRWLPDEEEGYGMYATSSYPYWSSTDLIVVDLFDEEEEVEFDIINIDKSLILLDLMPSCESRKIEPIQQAHDTRWMKEKKTSAIGSNTQHFPETVRYTGKSNAFLLELFAVHPDYDERYGYDMLEVAFELFPNKDYCITCLPSCQSAFPLLEHFVLCTPLCCRLKFIKESLYVAHINSVRGAVSVRKGEAVDLEALKDVLEHVGKRDALMVLFESTLTSLSLNSFVLLAENQPIGLIITKPLEDGFTIRSQYDLKTESQRPGTDGTIVAGVISPVLEVHSRWYMREVMRHTPYSTLFWSCQPEFKGSRNLMSFVERLIPIRPRRAIPNITGYSEIDIIYKEVSKPFALWAMERPLSALPKLNVNNNIVVVGASRTGLAFLEALIMGPSSKYLTFTNITLVSEQGLPVVSECIKAASTCVHRDGRYTERYIKSVPFALYIDVMAAVMVHIDRKQKCIHLKDGGVKYYDQLVITCGQQFQHPEYLRESLELVIELKKGKLCERMLMDNPKYQPDRVPPPPDLPFNVMLINTLFQANYCLKKLLRMVTENRDGQPSAYRPVVVYGDCIEAYSCMAALLEIGIKPHSILFVEPFPSEDYTVLRVNCFNDEKIDERVQETIEGLGIRVLRKTRLVNWQLSKGWVTSLCFMSYQTCISQPCFAFFYYGLKAIDLYAFKAINECGLVYDGGLIVGPTFETNDPAIYGAGTCVQYSRRLYATQKQQRYYSSEDTGESLAQLFLEKFDPFLMCNKEFKSVIGAMLNAGEPSMSDLPKIAEGPRGANNPNLSRRWQPVMKFESPIMIVATLPGPLYYMKLQKPSPDIPMEVHMSLPRRGHTLVTDYNDNYFRLHLNVLHTVDAVTCLSQVPFSADLFSQLYGKHEAFFNQLLLRFQIGLIVDLYKFFQMPWLSAVYHETFEELLNNINLQEVCTINELLKSEYTFTADTYRKSVAGLHSTIAAIPSLEDTSSCSDDTSPECSGNLENVDDDVKITTFRSLMSLYISSHPLMQFKFPPTDIPTECGQNESVRRDVLKFWQIVEGERIIYAHIANHISRNSVSNPHYAAPIPGFF